MTRTIMVAITTSQYFTNVGFSHFSGVREKNMAIRNQDIFYTSRGVYIIILFN